MRLQYTTIPAGIALLAALLYTLNPFLSDLAWATVLSILLTPLCSKLHQLKPSVPYPLLCSLTLLSCFALFSTPLFFIFSTLQAEITTLHHFIIKANESGLPPPTAVSNLPLVGTTLFDWWNDNLSQPNTLLPFLKHLAFSETSTNFAKALSSSTISLIFHLVIILISTLIFLIHHSHISSTFSRILSSFFPHHPHFQSAISTLPTRSIRSTAIGIGSVALLEGVLLGIAYHFAGAPVPTLLALATVYLALIPGGAPLAFSSVSLLLLSTGHPTQAIALFSWGAFELFLIDKFVRPKLIGSTIGLPFLPILLSLLGGVATFGPLGLFIGPTLMTLAFALLPKITTPTDTPTPTTNTAQS